MTKEQITQRKITALKWLIKDFQEFVESPSNARKTLLTDSAREYQAAEGISS